MSVPEHHPINMDYVDVEIQDVAGHEGEYSLLKNGFEFVKLRKDMLPIFSQILEEGLDGSRVGPQIQNMEFKGKLPVEEVLARALQGTDVFSLRDQFSMNLKCTGFVIRKGGPLGVPLNGSGFDLVAHRVHIDQDLEGDPLLSLGLTWLFRLPFISLLNVWTPLETPRMRPLAVMDENSIDPSFTLRYTANSTKNAGGFLGSFKSDRLMTIYHEGQKWYWNSNMTFGDALVFYTGVNPHTSFTIPGETIQLELLTQLYSLINEDNKEICSDEAEDRLLAEFNRLHNSNEPITPNALDAIISGADARAKACVELSRGNTLETETLTEIKNAMEYMSRSSLEIRCASLVAPRLQLYLCIPFGFLLLLLAVRCLNNACKSSRKLKTA
eukprot:CAMPEP_0184006324 /NCGR_PEP_ID=MMETSP0954-20121128/613_1 /TAXON_ID=627963 /ORGANISM="Aplanochytrium sp, Strain PBS07" /LENGTH=383 /DNA_ID=CAMNT_0026284827 /DNA_START=432 /DNA_END=1583 /DNA_ORIENTATION=-